MFSDFPLKIKNKFYDFKFIENDDTYPIILKDWNDYGKYILGSTKEFKTVIQAGGNCGLYPLLYSEFFDNVFTFEPDPKNFYCLTENCKTNKIVKFNAALGDKNTFLHMNIVNPVNMGMNKVVDGQGYKVYSVTLDSIDIPDVSLIHLDVEGFEYNVLLGAKETIKKYKPTIVLEIPENKEQIYKFLEELNYQEIFMYNGSSLNAIFTQKEI